MARQKQGFAPENKPLPAMTRCAGIGCGNDGETETTLFILTSNGKWMCRKCFFSGPARMWPRPKARRPKR